jgi:hypothetical protein
MIMTPNGIIEQGTVFNGSQWEILLVYGVGHSFDDMFEITEEPSQLHKFLQNEG